MPDPSSRAVPAPGAKTPARQPPWRWLAAPWAWRGALAAPLALLGLAANLWLPVLVIPGNPATILSRSQIPAGLAYQQEMLDWPLYACAAAAVLGLALLLLGRFPRPGRRHEQAGTLALAGLAASGFALAWMACRWLGFQVARLLDTQALAQLHAVPYVNLGLGLLFLGLSLPGLWAWVRPTARLPPAIQSAAWVLAACLLGLLLLPLLPTVAATRQGFTLHYDELSLETLRNSPAGLQAPKDWMWFRLLVEAQALLALACLAWGAFRLPGWRRAPALLALPLAAATVLAIQFYLHVQGLPNQARLWPNPLPPLVLAGLWAAAALGGARALKAARVQPAA